MKYLTFLLILSACASSGLNEYQKAYLSSTPTELCRGEERLRYETTEECKSDVARKQAQAFNILANMPRFNYQPIYNQAQPVPQVVPPSLNCQSVRIGNTSTMRCQ